MNETFICDICGEEHPLSERNEMDEQELCESCFQQETLCCSECDERIWQDNNAGDEDTPLCQRCFDRYYTTCAQCSHTLRSDNVYYADEEEEDPLCYDCYTHADSARIIRDYSYKPEAIFYGDGPRFLGVELELDEGGSSSDNARELLSLANKGEERFYCKHDGSLNDGFELVTHPCTLAYHQSQFPWEAVLSKCKLQVQVGHLW